MSRRHGARIDQALKSTPAFPPTFTLVDTGERRYPRTGESYMWACPTTGEIDGPHHCDDADEKTSWYGEPESFAIYQRIGRYVNQRNDDAPAVPAGLRKKDGVEIGCGVADCADCYEPMPPIGSLDNPLILRGE